MGISRSATFQTCSIGLKEPGTEDGTFIAIAVNFLRTGWEELGGVQDDDRKEGRSWAGQGGLEKRQMGGTGRRHANTAVEDLLSMLFFLPPSNTLLLSFFFFYHFHGSSQINF